jgi:hypothetical protein
MQFSVEYKKMVLTQNLCLGFGLILTNEPMYISMPIVIFKS